ncbi:unnamed protein product [Ectocarpus sp. 13 AM-2016]
MAKGRKRPASAIEEDRSSSAPLANGMASTATAADGSDGGGGPKALEHGAKNNEVKFGKHLASSDKRVRDRTVGALREWLRQRSRGGSLTDLDLLKIWRGLWYCMFMCDKAPVQRELAENLAGLLSLFKDDRAEGVRFFKSFCVTMQRDWERIDNLRIDKYYTLVRVFVREALAFCRLPSPVVEGQPKQKKKKKGKKNSPGEEAETSAKAGDVWDLGLLRAISDVMEVEVLTLRPAPIGLRLHLADVWAEEACNAGDADMPTEAFLVALAPWLRVAAEPETNPVVFRRTFEGVFEGLLGLFPEDKDGMEEEEEEEDEKKVFAAVELDRVQACLFEVAAAPQTRDKRRVKLYELHRRYQKRTGVAPDASAPPSGILPLPDESDDDEDEEGGSDGEYDGEFVEAGARRRAVRGPEPAVAGWVAAGIASGDISPEGGAERGGKKAKKRRKRSGSEDDEAEVDSRGEKKKRRSGEEEEEASAKERKKESRGSVEKDSADAAAAEVPAAAPAGVEAGAGAEAEAVTPGKNSTKKRKKEESSPPVDVSNGAVTVEGTGTVVAAAASGDGVSSPPSSGKRKKKKKRRVSVDGVATVAGDDAAAAVSTATAAAPEAEAAAGDGDGVSSPPSGGKRKKKDKERVSADGVATDAGDDVAAAASTATAAAPEAEAAAPADGVDESPSSSKKKKKKGKGEEEAAMPDAGESETTPEDDVTTTPNSSSEKKKKKKKKRPSLEAVASPTPPPGNTTSEDVSEPSSGSFHTPPKNAGSGGGSSSKKKKKKSPAAGESARKTVTFGANMAKEHQTSVKDLKTRVITPSKDAGTPQKGLLKVGGGGSGVKLMKPAAGRKDTPYAGKKKASDYF